MTLQAIFKVMCCAFIIGPILETLQDIGLAHGKDIPEDMEITHFYGINHAR